jgi:hypothetical protein
MKKLKLPDNYMEGEWYDAGSGLACRSILQGNKFVYICGFLVQFEDEGEMELIPVSVDHYPIQ